jgi:hypothetical protein
MGEVGPGSKRPKSRLALVERFADGPNIRQRNSTTWTRREAQRSFRCYTKGKRFETGPKAQRCSNSGPKRVGSVSSASIFTREVRIRCIYQDFVTDGKRLLEQLVHDKADTRLAFSSEHDDLRINCKTKISDDLEGL